MTIFSDDGEFLRYALSKYDNPHLSSLEEFESDIRRFSNLNALVTKYIEDKTNLNDRLIINHLIILSNCFTVGGLIKMVPYKIKTQNQEAVNTCMYWLGMFDEVPKLDFYLLDILND